MRYGTVLQRRISLGMGKWTYQYVMLVGPSPKGGPAYETITAVRLNDVGSSIRAGQIVEHLKLDLFEIKP